MTDQITLGEVVVHFAEEKLPHIERAVRNRWREWLKTVKTMPEWEYMGLTYEEYDEWDGLEWSTLAEILRKNMQ